MRKLVATALALAALVPATALAGGWATVQLSSTPKGAKAGVPWVVSLTVLQHGQTPLANLQPHVRIEQGTRGTQEEHVPQALSVADMPAVPHPVTRQSEHAREGRDWDAGCQRANICLRPALREGTSNGKPCRVTRRPPAPCRRPGT